MKKITLNSLIFLLTLGLALPAFARVSLYDIEREQRWRIKEGVYSGELTRKEARSLRREQRRIRMMKRDFLDDGRLTRHERRTLRKRYSRASHRIYRLKHNSRRSYSYGRGPFSPRYDYGHGRFGFMFGHRF